MQLEFFRKFLFSKDVTAYLSTRDLKYRNRENVLLQMEKKNVHTLAYFPQWLSGFIEREGCFSVRNNKNGSFSIGQNHDFYLIHSIQQFLGTNNKIKLKKEKFYCVQLYRRAVFLFFETHFKQYPLLGEKNVSFQTFVEKLNLSAEN